MTALLRTFPGMLPMQLGTDGEVRVFLLSALIGVALGAVYELLRVLRVIIPHFKWAVFVEDMLFGLLCGFCWFLIFSGFSQPMRAFIAFAMALGAAVLHFAAGRPLVALIRRICRRIKGFLAKTAQKVRRKFV
jgi:hypothetical protein